MMRTKLLFATLLASGAALAQTAVSPLVMKTPNEYRIVSASGNGKWACGVYADYGDERYAFLWNLESGEIELLNPANPSIAYSVSDDGVVVGQYTDNTYKTNGASVTLAGYWANHKWNRFEMPDNDVNFSNAYCISPDGHYVSGVVQKGDVYTGYVWKDGKIYKQLQNRNNCSMAYTISPDGKTVAGWVQDKNRTAAIWDVASGEYTMLNPEYQSPWSSCRKFSHNGEKLLYFGGWTTLNGKTAATVVYDMATKEKTSIVPRDDMANFDVFDLTDDASIIMCENNDRGYIYKDGAGYYADDYLKAQGIDLAAEHVFLAPETDYYQVVRASTISADGNVMGFQYYNDDKDENGNYSVSMQSMVVKFNQTTTGLCPVGVKASQLSGISSVLVSWKPNVAAKGITGYNVYRDGEKLNGEVITGESFVDSKVPVGKHSYSVSAVYGDAESVKSSEVAVAVVTKELSTPSGVFAQQHGYNSAYLEWANPYTNFSSLTYFNADGADIETFGLGYDNLSYETAILFDKTELGAYKGQKITSVGFYPLEEQGGWKINLYTHDAEGKLQRIYSQPVTQKLNCGMRNVVKLDTPQDIPSGDLLVALEVAVTKASQSINALDYGRAVEGYSDLLRLTTEDDFYSIGQLMQTENYLYAASWAIDATIAPEGADMNKDNVKSYNVFVDGSMLASSEASPFLIPNLSEGNHTVGVSAVYEDGQESAVNYASLAIVPNDEQLEKVDEVNVEKTSATAVKATWEAPEYSDNVNVQYCSGEASTQTVKAPAENNYGLMASAIYPSKTFRGRDGYVIRSARFYPLADATFTAYLYKNGEMVSEAEVDDYTVGQWNEVAFPEPIAVDSKAQYQLVIDCYDVTPNSAALAVDKTASLTGYSDLYSLDGSSWNPLTSVAVYANWMIGLNIENPSIATVPATGYDVLIDGAKKNAEMIKEPSFCYDFGKEDNNEHTIQVNAYYPLSPVSVAGGITRFYISSTGIDNNVIESIEIRQGNNELSVMGNDVKSVEIVSAAGQTIASAAGNTVSIDGVAAGTYIVKAIADGKKITRKIAIVR